jgi:hypothetical protein
VSIFLVDESNNLSLSLSLCVCVCVCLAVSNRNTVILLRVDVISHHILVGWLIDCWLLLVAKEEMLCSLFDVHVLMVLFQIIISALSCS